MLAAPNLTKQKQNGGVHPCFDPIFLCFLYVLVASIYE